MTAAAIAQADVLEALQVPGKEFSAAGPFDSLPAGASTAGHLVAAQRSPIPPVPVRQPPLSRARPGGRVVTAAAIAQADVLEALQVPGMKLSAAGLPGSLPAGSSAAGYLVAAQRSPIPPVPVRQPPLSRARAGGRVVTAAAIAKADVLAALQAPGTKLSTARLPDLPAGALACVATLEALQVLRQECGGSGRSIPLSTTSGTVDMLVTAQCRTDLTFPAPEIVDGRTQAVALEAFQGIHQEFSADPLPADSGALVTTLRRTNITPPSKKAADRNAAREEAAT